MRNRFGCAEALLVLTASLQLISVNSSYAQTAIDSTKYIKSKLSVSPETDSRIFVDLNFEDDHMLYSYNTYIELMEGRSITNHRQVIPMKKIKAISESELKEWRSDSNAPSRLHMECETDASKCITAQTCAPTGSNRCSDEMVTSVSLDISNLTIKDRIRVIDAMVHIKKEYPSVVEKEMFDK
ncbi:hypothetical protein GCM10008965_33830 [Methylorubrum aminovorans]|nr:hypothetical protein GCM10025880_27450 [Methylorubrum aminovorans]